MNSCPGSCSFSSKIPPIVSLHTQNRIEMPPPTPCLQGPTWPGPSQASPALSLAWYAPATLTSFQFLRLSKLIYFLSLCCLSFLEMHFLLKSRGLSPGRSQLTAPSQRGLSGPPELPSHALLSSSCFVFFLAPSICGYLLPLSPARNHCPMRAAHGLSCTSYLGQSQLMVSSQ